ncbi:hypothetical protein OTU49_017417, partial [Cherax quadricarinatus]
MEAEMKNTIRKESGEEEDIEEHSSAPSAPEDEERFSEKCSTGALSMMLEGNEEVLAVKPLLEIPRCLQEQTLLEEQLTNTNDDNNNNNNTGHGSEMSTADNGSSCNAEEVVRKTVFALEHDILDETDACLRFTSDDEEGATDLMAAICRVLPELQTVNPLCVIHHSDVVLTDVKSSQGQVTERVSDGRGPVDMSSEVTKEAPTELTVEPPMELPTEPPTEPPMEPPMEPPTEPPMEPPTEPPLEPPMEPPTEPSMEPPTELLMEPPMELPSEPPMEPPPEPPTEPEHPIIIDPSSESQEHPSTPISECQDSTGIDPPCENPYVVCMPKVDASQDSHVCEEADIKHTHSRPCCAEHSEARETAVQCAAAGNELTEEPTVNEGQQEFLQNKIREEPTREPETECDSGERENASDDEGREVIDENKPNETKDSGLREREGKDKGQGEMESDGESLSLHVPMRREEASGENIVTNETPAKNFETEDQNAADEDKILPPETGIDPHHLGTVFCAEPYYATVGEGDPVPVVVQGGEKSCEVTESEVRSSDSVKEEVMKNAAEHVYEIPSEV